MRQFSEIGGLTSREACEAAGIACWVVFAAAACCSLFLTVQTAKAQADATLAWAPKPVHVAPYRSPNKPIWKMSQIVEKHAKQSNWTETLVDTPSFMAAYISMAPGGHTQKLFYSDDRTFWVVQAGQIRFEIEGQPAFVASKGFLVQVPSRVPFTLETVGDVPSLRFEVHPSEPPIFPIAEKPMPIRGITYIQGSFKGHGTYDDQNKPFLDFEKDIVQAHAKPPATFLEDPYMAVEIFRGPPVPIPAETDRGHFRANLPGCWFVLEGKENFLIEGVAPFVAEAGDVVFAPVGRWHRVTAGGEGVSTRLAINARPGNLHWYQPSSARGQ
jgi:mannose-6-phosphate isomerase-like protein (cupin superfamily)